MPNPIGPDGLPMERHHTARQDGETELIWKTVHDIIHQDERDAVRPLIKKGHPGGWTLKTPKQTS